MEIASALRIIAQGAWHGGTLVDNSVYENIGMTFKGNIPVNSQTIQQRIGIRTRMAARADERIGTAALEDLLATADLDPGRIKVVIGATNVGEDLYDPGPLVRYPFELLADHCPQATVFDLYAGCPGFNVSVELLLMLSLTGVLRPGDVSIVIGAENIHRARAFRPGDTANIIFGDDAMATALQTTAEVKPEGRYRCDGRCDTKIGDNPVEAVADALFSLTDATALDGIVLDNQTGFSFYRVPALAARIQHRLVELSFPEAVERNTFRRFKDALSFYDRNVDSFAYDIMTLKNSPETVESIAWAYVASGRCSRVASVFVSADGEASVKIHEGEGFERIVPQTGVVDAATRTHGCFADFIQAVKEGDHIYGEMNGKGVFLYATRGARAHLDRLLSRNRLAVTDLDLLVEHQANFAMIPMTLEQVLADRQDSDPNCVADFLANKMVTNIHVRGNCSVVCMQRLPYDLQRGALRPDTINGYAVNRNLDALKTARIVLNDSVGAGMIRSSFLQRHRR